MIVWPCTLALRSATVPERIQNTPEQRLPWWKITSPASYTRDDFSRSRRCSSEEGSDDHSVRQATGHVEHSGSVEAVYDARFRVRGLEIGMDATSRGDPWTSRVSHPTPIDKEPLNRLRALATAREGPNGEPSRGLPQSSRSSSWLV